MASDRFAGGPSGVTPRRTDEHLRRIQAAGIAAGRHAQPRGRRLSRWHPGVRCVGDGQATSCRPTPPPASRSVDGTSPPAPQWRSYLIRGPTARSESSARNPILPRRRDHGPPRESRRYRQPRTTDLLGPSPIREGPRSDVAAEQVADDTQRGHRQRRRLAAAMTTPTVISPWGPPVSPRRRRRDRTRPTASTGSVRLIPESRTPDMCAKELAASFPPPVAHRRERAGRGSAAGSGKPR